MKQLENPIRYSFSHSLDRDKNKNLTGFFDVIINAECKGFQLYELRLRMFDSKRFPHLKEKCELVRNLCFEESYLCKDGLVYKNQDCLIKLGLSNEDLARYSLAIRLALQDIDQKLESSEYVTDTATGLND